MQRYSLELKEQVIKEVKEVGNISSVSRKHGLKANTVHGWIKATDNKEVIDGNKQLRQLQKKLADKELEIQVLKLLLKKTYQVWDKEDPVSERP